MELELCALFIECNKFIISHQNEILAIKSTVQKVALTAYRAVEEALRSTRIKGSRRDQGSSTDGTDAPRSTDESSVASF
ncbi:hypothetical protein MPTK1_6g11560 [Marchantia polymorpha subsp. ruderalis]|uniref:Uncharacterized protein n=2 Tax=Marchantia polymorpha TaxID=3197 RepID=A0AAF6BQY7_MARPO|nr:hypothetical protein MARPO_0016s0196 [Marchantia polymorpha]BBN14421.1 hypothetical protein Mp_6g11560 [Marchantia polymorpha subsp. ruderalis]|eukprot:PTQ45156.1 hypothetical protein MARPO_0016s0196 [Marchantia polymorpha]